MHELSYSDFKYNKDLYYIIIVSTQGGGKSYYFVSTPIKILFAECDEYPFNMSYQIKMKNVNVDRFETNKRISCQTDKKKSWMNQLLAKLISKTKQKQPIF